MKRISYLNKRPLLIALALIVTFVSFVFYELVIKDKATSNLPDGVFYVQILDIGQGDSSLLTSPAGEFVLIDTGPGASDDDLITHLDEAGVKTIEYLILTHPHEDHIGGTPAVLDNYEVKNIIMSDATADTSIFRRTLEAIENEGCETILATPGNTYKFGECKIELLGPHTTEDKDLNNTSVVCKVSYGTTSFLFTGDMEAEYEKELIEEFGSHLDSDVLKVGHHGSSTSSCEEFLKTVTPDIAVISCADDNDYGHPHTEVIKRLDELGIDYHRTDKEGTVIVRSDGKEVKLYKAN